MKLTKDEIFYLKVLLKIEGTETARSIMGKIDDEIEKLDLYIEDELYKEVKKMMPEIQREEANVWFIKCDDEHTIYCSPFPEGYKEGIYMAVEDEHDDIVGESAVLPFTLSNDPLIDALNYVKAVKLWIRENKERHESKINQYRRRHLERHCRRG